MDEVAETVLRCPLPSVLFDGETSSSGARPHRYPHRRMVPALGLIDR